jgi:alpha-amylase
MIVLTEQGNPVTEPSPNGTTTFAGDTWNVYVARRQGNGTKSGGILVINNNNSLTRGIWIDNDGSPNGTATAGYTDWKNLTLINVINPAQTVTVAADGRVHLYAPARGYSIWVPQSEYIIASKGPVAPVTEILAEEKPKEKEDEFRSIAAYPNPSSGQTTIEFTQVEKGMAKLEVYDASGKLINVLVNGELEKGRHKKTFTSNTSGVFTYKYSSGERVETGRVVIQK